MKPYKRVERLVSAGGVVYRESGAGTEIVVCRRDSPAVMGLPKSTPEPGETQEQTALREVREETGLEVACLGLIGSINYWFQGRKPAVRYDKTVYFYLMSPTGGDLALHDHEFDAVDWLPYRDALAALTYESEVEIVRKGLAMVAVEEGAASIE